MQQELRAAQAEAFNAAAYASDCYRAASRAIWKANDSQRAQLFERMGDMYMAICQKAKEEIAFLEWAIRTEEAYDTGYWSE